MPVTTFQPVASRDGALKRGAMYVPRFMRHFRRRRRANMSLGAAWHSARLRMHDY